MQSKDVAIFWDYESCNDQKTVDVYEVVQSIRSVALSFGIIRQFKAYDIESSELIVDHDLEKPLIRSMLQLSGVSMTNCLQYDDRDDAVERIMLVDMLAYAIDSAGPSQTSQPTIILISGDRNFAYAMSMLRMRGFKVVLISLDSVHMSLNAQASEHLEWNTDILGVGALGNGYFLNESTSSRNSIRRDRDSKNALDGGYQMLKSPRGRVNDLSRPSMTEGNGQRSRMESPTYSTTPASAKSQGKLRDHSSTNHSDTQSSLASDDVFTITDGKFDDQQPGDMSEIDLAVPTPAPLQAPSGYGSTTVYAPEALQNLSAWPLQPDAEPNLIGTRPPSHTGPAGESGSALSLPQNLPKPSPKKVASVFPQSSEGVATTSKLIPVIYQPLVTSLQQYRSKGVHKVPRSKFAEELVKRHPGLYQRAGVLKFSQYVVLAQKAGIIRLGGKDGNEWISLRPSVA